MQHCDENEYSNGILFAHANFADKKLKLDFTKPGEQSNFVPRSLDTAIDGNKFTGKTNDTTVNGAFYGDNARILPAITPTRRKTSRARSAARNADRLSLQIFLPRKSRMFASGFFSACSNSRGSRDARGIEQALSGRRASGCRKRVSRGRVLIRRLSGAHSSRCCR